MYHASAYSLAAEFERPKKHSLSPQASVVLPGHGGHGSLRVPGYKVDGLISFKEAYSEVGGSYDECHDIHTTHAWSVVEGLNVADMLTADRVVSRIAIYHAADGKSEASYDITGSYFENLRIAGHKVDIKLATHVFHDHDTYSKITSAHKASSSDKWLTGGELSRLKKDELEEIENNYHALHGLAQRVKDSKTTEGRKDNCGSYWLSPVDHSDLASQIASSEIKVFGSIICIPKFGVIRLAEMMVQRHSRSLRMVRVQMCSSGHGTMDGGSTNGGSSGG
jgi:hypothetical protein